MDVFEGAQLVLKSRDSNRDPKLGDWGFCASGSAPATMGGGIESFYWFWKKDDLINTLEEWLVYCYQPSHYVNFDVMAGAARQLTAKWKSGQIDSDTLCQLLSKELKGHIKVVWVGSFEQLASGEGVRAEAIVRHALELSESDPVPNLLAQENAELLADFTEALQKWEV